MATDALERLSKKRRKAEALTTSNKPAPRQNPGTSHGPPPDSLLATMKFNTSLFNVLSSLESESGGGGERPWAQPFPSI